MSEQAVLVDLVTATASARRAWRKRIVDVCRWSLERGRSVKPELIALILAAREESGFDGAPDRWTRLGVYHCLWADTFNWCGLRRVLVPEEVPEALWIYLHYLRERDLFKATSDPFGELLKPLRCYGALDTNGRPDLERTTLPIPCECYVPYEPVFD